MEFKEFNEKLQENFSEITKDKDYLFVTDVPKDDLWNLYLESFPKGTNEIFRERREYDCNCCKSFIRAFGNVVVIEDNKLKSIWDFNVDDEKYQTVINSLSSFVKSEPIREVFLTKEKKFGTEFNREMGGSGTIRWYHFYINLPNKFVSSSSKTLGTLKGKYTSTKEVFKRSLEEINQHSVDTVLELIYQKSLYKGEEWKSVLEKFLDTHKEYQEVPDNEKDNYCWDKSTKVGSVIGKIRNHSIGTLLTNISNGMDLNEAVTKYESIVAPTNYKRPKAIFTKKMIEQAQKKVEELGLTESLGRRFANINDITINNILFANKDSKNKITGSVFDDMKKEVPVNLKEFDKVEEVSIEEFVDNILPKVNDIQLLLENKHESNLISLIGPKDVNSKPLFKWDNNFSWAYKGNITDSMKDLVKKHGGKTTGVLRFSIQWNDNGDNENDFDAHCVEPGGSHIFFNNAKVVHKSSGMLDVDIINPHGVTSVENIIWTDVNKMRPGIYRLYVHNYTHRCGRSGFSAEVEFNDKIFQFEYRKDIPHNGKITVAEVELTKDKEFKIIKSLPSDEKQNIKEFWNLKTNQFYPVSVMMFSPNYWDGKHGIGNKHYFFMLDDCINDERPNGFFNEFIKEELMPHKKVFEALGGKMKVDHSNDQLSGLGFSSTKRNSLVCKVNGSFTRTLKINF